MKWLVMCTGYTLKEYRQQIIDYIIREKPVTVGVHNFGDICIPEYAFFSSLFVLKGCYDRLPCDSTVVIKSEMKRKYKKLGIPNKCLTYSIKYTYPSVRGHLYIAGDKIVCDGGNGGTIAAAWAIMRGADEVCFVGMDGYEKIRPHHNGEWYTEPEDVLKANGSATWDILGDLSKMANIKILTPTAYAPYFREEL